ncbi:MAG: ABC transporter ATP-binding protein/permease [Chloroflexota bacterium]|nr:ABC transporter ATP-binding protein/permease [Chloroflexota bacterium]
MRIPLGSYWSLLAGYLRAQRGRVALLALLLFGGIALQLVNPLILRFFIDAALAGAATATLTSAATSFIAIALVGQTISLAETYVAEQVGWSATNALRADLTRHCLDLDLGFHHAHPPGALIERVDGDVTVLANFFSRFAIAVLGNLLLLVGILAVLFGVDWRAGLILSAFALVVLLALHRLQGVAAPRWRALRGASADLYAFLEERLAGTEDLRANGAVAYTLGLLDPLLGDMLRRLRAASVAGGASWLTTVMLFALGTAVALALGAALFRAGAITLGTVYLIFSYTEQLRRPIEQLTRQVQDLQQASAGIARVRELLDTESAVADGPGAALPAGALALTFDDVSFGYTAAGPVLRDLSFHLPAGRTLGLLGRTGSGKTTLARLIFRLYGPGAGVVRVGGVDVRDLRLADLRARVGLVTQDVQLFAASVRDNLTFFDRCIPDERLLQVLAELGLQPWYRALPAGLDTPLAPDSLSAGEAQLVALCRVFLKDPGLVILDEAAARLDPATEALLERALDSLLAGRTAIVIAHRLATVGRADDILILEGGRAVEHGPRERLARDPRSRFARLLQSGLAEVTR